MHQVTVVTNSRPVSNPHTQARTHTCAHMHAHRHTHCSNTPGHRGNQQPHLKPIHTHTVVTHQVTTVTNSRPVSNPHTHTAVTMLIAGSCFHAALRLKSCLPLFLTISLLYLNRALLLVDGRVWLGVCEIVCVCVCVCVCRGVIAEFSGVCCC